MEILINDENINPHPPSFLGKVVNFFDDALMAADRKLTDIYYKGSAYANENPKLKYIEEHFPAKMDHLANRI
jgi:hypothetical protein